MTIRCRIMGLLVSLCVLVSASGMAATVDMADMDMQFVDAWESTGYYVDAGSLEFSGPQQVTARVGIVQADKDRLYLYKVHFNRAKRTYQILESIVAEYATKEELSSNMTPTAETVYAPGSPMEAVVEFIFSLPS